MKYEKPEVVVLAPATFAVQSGHKVNNGQFDGTSYTTGAYEADE